MDTERQGRSADVWCHSGMCTNRPPVCALVPSLLCSELPLSSYLSTKHKLELQCDHMYFIYTLSSIVYIGLCSAWCFSWPVVSNNSKALNTRSASLCTPKIRIWWKINCNNTVNLCICSLNALAFLQHGWLWSLSYYIHLITEHPPFPS